MKILYTNGRKVYNPGRKGLHGAGDSEGGKVEAEDTARPQIDTGVALVTGTLLYPSNLRHSFSSSGRDTLYTKYCLFYALYALFSLFSVFLTTFCVNLLLCLMSKVDESWRKKIVDTLPVHHMINQM